MKKAISFGLALTLSLSLSVVALAKPKDEVTEPAVAENATDVLEASETMTPEEIEAALQEYEEALKQAEEENTEVVVPDTQAVFNNPIDSLYATTGFRAIIPSAIGTMNYINAQVSSGRNIMYLPASANLKNISFDFNIQNSVFINDNGNAIQIQPGEPINIAKYVSLKKGDGSRMLKLSVVVNGEFVDYDLYFIQSANVASMHIKSEDPVNKGLVYVATVKGNASSGTVDLVNADGSVVYAGGFSSLKGRGNSTWDCLKKPFQIKLSNSTDLIQTGNDKNKSRTWILLANAFDPTLIHNTVAFDMASSMGLIAPDHRPVDLYYDGQYVGSYLLTEKVEPGKGRVPIDDNGFLLELDLMYGNQEDYYFTDVKNNTFVVKAPDKVSDDQLDALEAFMNDVILAAENNGISPVTGISVWDYVDIDSLASMYVLLEMTGNPDMFVSSTFFYLPKDGKLTAGPVWDFDSSFGIRTEIGAQRTYGMTANSSWIGYFLTLPEFRKAVRNAERAKCNGIVNDFLSKGIDANVNLISASQRMDELLWNQYNIGIYHESDNYSSDIKYMKSFLRNRNSWMYANIGK